MSRSNALSRSAYNRSYLATRRAALKAAGLCQWCGARPAKPSVNKRSPGGIGCRCVECAQAAAGKHAPRMRRLRSAWKHLGICMVCGQREAMPRDTRCGVCAEAQDEYHAKARNKVPLLPGDLTLLTRTTTKEAI